MNTRTNGLFLQTDRRSVSGILDKFRIGGKLCRRKGKYAFVCRKGLTLKCITTLIRPQILICMKESETDKIGTPVSFPHKLPSTLLNQEFLCDF